MKCRMKNHPTITHATEIADICQPLKKLNISYFSHVRIDDKKNFTSICSNPAFAEHYIDKEYYNADIHMAGENTFGNFVIWDAIELTNKSAELHQEALAFGHQHIFTIYEKNKDHSNFYHFGTNLKSPNINHSYLKNRDLLQFFITHFNEKISQSNSLLTAYDIPFGIDKVNNGFSIENKHIFDIQRDEFMREMQLSETSNQNDSLQLAYKFLSIPSQQMKCLTLLVDGHSTKQIADQLSLSPRTVNHYLEIIRKNLGFSNSKKLIAAYYAYLASSPK